MELHGQQAPHDPETLSILTPLLKTLSAAGNLVLDPFSGSGSTLLAAKTLGRDYVGIELDAGYHAIATRRLAEAIS